MARENKAIRGQDQGAEEVRLLGDPLTSAACQHTCSACIILIIVLLCVLPQIFSNNQDQKDGQTIITNETVRNLTSGRNWLFCISKHVFDTKAKHSLPKECTHIAYNCKGPIDWTESLVHPLLLKEPMLTQPIPTFVVLRNAQTMLEFIEQTKPREEYASLKTLEWLQRQGLAGLILEELFHADETPEERRNNIEMLKTLYNTLTMGNVMLGLMINSTIIRSFGADNLLKLIAAVDFFMLDFYRDYMSQLVCNGTALWKTFIQDKLLQFVPTEKFIPIARLGGAIFSKNFKFAEDSIVTLPSSSVCGLVYREERHEVLGEAFQKLDAIDMLFYQDELSMRSKWQTVSDLQLRGLAVQFIEDDDEQLRCQKPVFSSIKNITI